MGLRDEEVDQTVGVDSSPLGCTGFLIVGTRGRAGPGEVLIEIRGGSEAYLAFSDEPLPKGESVLVVETLGARTVGIVAWTPPFPTTGQDSAEEK
ncbi:MAG: hypothetical protein JWQ81_8446 [Amycolatopsis sp.]|jgi:hypothetical protein|nr:hypothetical protein [Amycolatopsis sp.]